MIKSLISNINCILTVLIFLTSIDSNAQSCYVTLNDVSGYSPQVQQEQIINSAACILRDSFPLQFQGDFKVFDVGFYMHSETTIEGFPAPFKIAREQASQQSLYYLLFGKQTDSTGLYTKFWVDIKLPETFQFSCMSNLQRELYSLRIASLTNAKYDQLGRPYQEFEKAEVSGIHELIKILSEIKNCCIVQNKKPLNKSSCNGCNLDLMNNYFKVKKFDEYTVKSVVSQGANFSTSYIKDMSIHKIKKEGGYDYISNLLDAKMSSLNQLAGVNLLITSDEQICDGSSDIHGKFIENREFGVWINIGEHHTLDSSFLHAKVIWNPSKKKVAKSEEEASSYKFNIMCQVLTQLKVPNSPCASSPPPDIDVTYPFCQTNSTVNPNPHSIKWFIDTLIAEENKYPESERRNTKLMFTRLRKIFYNTPAWNEIIIPATKNIPGRYNVSIIAYPGFPKYWPNPGHYSVSGYELLHGLRFQDNEGRPINAVGQSPNIYCDDANCSNFNQEVFLNNSQCIIDIGHVFTGIDALNNPSTVFYSQFSISTNAGAATWVGDIGSVISAWAFERDQLWCQYKDPNRYPTNQKIQELVNSYSSGADMIGNIDAYVINDKYHTGSANGMKVSEIFTDYYLGDGQNTYQKHRYSIFASKIGLTWDGSTFTNYLNDKRSKFILDIRNFSLLFTLASIKNFHPTELLKSYFVEVGLLFTTDQIAQHLDIFIDELKLKILSEN